MNPAKSAAKPAAPGVQPSYTQVNPGTGRIIHNGKSYRVILHYDAGTKELNTEEQLNRIKKILDLSRIGKNEKLSDITIEDGKVFRTKEPIERKLSNVPGVNVNETLSKIKKTFDKVILNAGIAPPADDAAVPAIKPVSKKAAKAAAAAAKAAKAAAAAAKPAAAKPKAQPTIELETDDETASVDGEEASQESEQEDEVVDSDGASSTDNSESGDEDFNDVDAAAKAAAKPAANAAAKSKVPAAIPVANSPAKPKAPAATSAAKPAAQSESEVDESERSDASEAAESDEDEVKVGDGTTVEFVAADLLGHDEIPEDVMNKVVASTKVPAEKIKGYIPTHDHNTFFRAYGMSYLVSLYHTKDFTKFDDIIRAEIVKLPQTEKDKILQEYDKFVTDLNDLRTNPLVEFLEFLESEQNDKLLCQLLRSLVRREVNKSDESQIKKDDVDALIRIFTFGVVAFPNPKPIGEVAFDKSLWLYKTDNGKIAILLRIHEDEDESLV